MVIKQAIFQVGEEVYGLNIMDVSTVEKPIAKEKATKAPKHVKGMIPLRGESLPVYSLRSKFGLEERESSQETRLIITNSNGMTIAYEVDRLIGIIDLEPQQLYEVPPIAMSKETAYMKQITNLDGQLVILLDHDRILSEEERDALQQMKKK